MTAPKLKSKKPCCGLCGKVGKVRKTDCCRNWICDDHDKYVPFSYSRNSCNRNHDRYTLCGSHYNEEHAGHWKDCDECRNPSKPRCTSGTEPTSTISRNWRIRPHSSQPSALSVGRSSIWAQIVSHNVAKNSHAGNAARRRCARYCAEKLDPNYPKPNWLHKPAPPPLWEYEFVMRS